MSRTIGLGLTIGRVAAPWVGQLRSGRRLLVEEPVDGTMRITHQGRALDFHAITSRSMKAAEA
ncbi:MAG: hypothetical protein HOP32_17770 [Nitrospira sp.]|nr:hypothetical protein [Nitrospira sp.]